MVYISATGSPKPVKDVSFWRGIGEESVEEGRLRQLKASTDRHGRFSIPVDIGVSDATVYRGGKVERTEGWVEDIVFVLRAPGCDDLLLHFDQHWKAGTLTMSCPGRAKKR